MVDMKLIDIKDTLPVGFIPIQETVDTRKLVSVPAVPRLGGAAGGAGLCPGQRDAPSAALGGIFRGSSSRALQAR